MKKGISLIVLVITIIVMIIIAGAIILSLSSSDVVGKANYAKISADRANMQSELAIEYAEWVAENDGEIEGKIFTYSRAATLPAGFRMSTDGMSVEYSLNLADVPTPTPDWYKGN